MPSFVPFSLIFFLFQTNFHTHGYAYMLPSTKFIDNFFPTQRELRAIKEVICLLNYR